MRIVFVTALIVLGCGEASSPDLPDEEYSKLLLGTWIAENSFDGGGEMFYGEKIYRKNGTASGFISNKIRQSSGEYKEAFYVTYESRWRVENGVLIIWDLRSQPPREGEKNKVIRDKIVSIDDSRAVFESLSRGSRFERTRKGGI